MAEQKKIKTEETDIVTTSKFQWKDLIRQEDWLAIWIGFIVIVLAGISVLTGAFDFSAAKFSTWGNGTSFLEQLNGAFFGKLILTLAVLGVLFTAGNALRGVSVKKYIPAFAGLFVLAILVRFISAECR